MPFEDLSSIKLFLYTNLINSIKIYCYSCSPTENFPAGKNLKHNCFHNWNYWAPLGLHISLGTWEEVRWRPYFTKWKFLRWPLFNKRLSLSRGLLLLSFSIRRLPSWLQSHIRDPQFCDHCIFCFFLKEGHSATCGRHFLLELHPASGTCWACPRAIKIASRPPDNSSWQTSDLGHPIRFISWSGFNLVQVVTLDHLPVATWTFSKRY